MHTISTTRPILTGLLLLFLQVAPLSAQTITTPPPFSVRAMAEWEELQALVVTWKPSTGGNAWRNTLSGIVKAAQDECKVIVICDSPNTAAGAKNYLHGQSVDTTKNLDFFIAPNNTIWVRDYGPNCVYAGDVDSLLLVDWIYNRNRASDNVIPEKIGQHLGFPVYSTTVAPYDLVNTGGNFMTDGMGTAFASKLIFRNNDQVANGEGSDPDDTFGTSDHTEAGIDSIQRRFMGIERYIKMEELLYDGIHHIDMHMKLLDEETLLVGQYPPDIADGPQIEANLQYVLSGFKTPFGNPYKVVRIPMPPSSTGNYPPFPSALYPTYANAVFVNGTVIMPKYNIALDTAARDTFQKYLPGYKIAQVDCNSIINSGGAVHCITKEIGVNDPLLITHSALPCQDNSLTPVYPVYASLKHRSGIAYADVWYSNQPTGPWQSVPMQQVDGDTAYLWLGEIPHQPAGSTVYYSIHAAANNGKKMQRPLTAPAGYWSFCVTQSSGNVEIEAPELQKIYPNPASAITVIPVESAVATRATIRLINALGQTAMVLFNGDLPAGNSQYFLDASRLPEGVYWVELQNQAGRRTQKLIVHR